jgi:PTS system ascorbate-specific IIA component
MLLDVVAEDWASAIRFAGTGLILSGRAQQPYVDAMVQSVESYGPYIVIAPGVALAHAAISPAVLSPGFSLARLARPVAFGDEPVRLVFALAAAATEAHAALMGEFSRWLSEFEQVNFLLNATSEAEIRASIVASSARIAE